MKISSYTVIISNLGTQEYKIKHLLLKTGVLKSLGGIRINKRDMNDV